MQEWTTELTDREKERLVRYIGAVLPIEERRPPPKTLWHYTTGEGLVGILQGGELYATHVSCLNDHLEHLHLTRVMRKKLDKRLVDASPQIRELYEALRKATKTRDPVADSAFVTCFTTAKDDLSQWRGYGGGECGFAIGFDGEKLQSVIGSEPNRALMRMRYKRAEHDRLATTIIDQIEEVYAEGNAMSEQYFSEYRDFVEWVSGTVKHHKFRAEKEYRFFSRLHPAHEIHFRQKKTLLSRHIKVALTVAGRLPITRIIVGPGGAQKVSRVSVSDLLKRWGYEGIVPELSKVPYRVP